jgi:hypothetical protein
MKVAIKQYMKNPGSTTTKKKKLAQFDFGII